MAFALRHLSVLAYAQGFTLWHYRAEDDDRAEIAAPRYFDTGADMLAPGDMVLVSAKDGGSVLCVTATPAGLCTAPLG